MSVKTVPGVSVPLELIPSGLNLRQFTRLKTRSGGREDPDDPFYIMDVHRLTSIFKLWTATFPTIKPYYAVKCNDDPVLLSILSHLGTGFDCASKGEISRILELGVAPNDIIFANPCKQTSHIKYAAKKGVSLVTFDNEMELHKLALHHNDSRLVVRICADDVTAKCQLGLKFGCSVPDACSMLHVAKYLGLTVVGVSFHVGSGCQSPAAYKMALEMSHKVFQYAEEVVGYHFTLLDIGGGFPGSDKDLPLFQEIAVTINSNIEKLFSEQSDLVIIAEPGRFFASSCFSLAVQVTSKRSITTGTNTDDNTAAVKNEEGGFMYYVNDGVYGSFNCLIYDHAEVEPLLLTDEDATTLSHCNQVPPSVKCSIWGPTCDSLDKICDAHLPEVNIGDWILFEDMGAYTMSACSSFNGFLKPKVFYCVKEEERSSFEEVYTCILTGRLLPQCHSGFVSPSEAFQDQDHRCHANPVIVTELQVSC